MRRRIFSLGLVQGALVALLLGASLSPSAHTADASREIVIKAHLLRHFAKYVTWPEAAFHDEKSPFVIGVLGEDPFEQQLDKAVEGQTVHNRSFGVRRLPVVDGELPSREELSGVHVLFVSSSERDRLPQIFERLQGSTVMTVSDVEYFAEAGGVAELARIGANIKVRYNLSAAEAAGLEASSRLLRLVIPVGPKR